MRAKAARVPGLRNPRRYRRARLHPRWPGGGGIDLDTLSRVFLETCDVYLGFKLIPDAYPPWLAVTRPYYRTSYVLVTANPAWTSLADMPRGQAIGSNHRNRRANTL